jgi:hypothetical protein
MHYFITLFDKNYLSRGLALYQSLLKNCNNFVLYVLAIDTETEKYLGGLKEPSLKVLSLSLVESWYPELLSVKRSRGRGEYCWTLTPYCIQYAITTYNINSCIYVDADIYFYSNPENIINAIKNNSVIITEHKYSPEYDQTYSSGKYCVQFMYFRNDPVGLNVLEWWRQRCFEWCYAKAEDGKFGDQKYLDDWTTRFSNIFVPTHIGCGLAPWNINKYDLNFIDGKLYVLDKVTKESDIAIFYHFHSLKKIYESSESIIWSMCDSYNIDDPARKFLYKEYINILMTIEKELNKSLVMPVVEKKNIPKPSFFFILRLVVRNIMRSLLVVKQYRFLRKEYFEQYNKFNNALVKISR